MTTAPELVFSTLVVRAYSDGYAFHGDISLPRERFENHLCQIMEKHLGRHAPAATRLSFLRALHTTDLYLTVACSQPTELAWRRFVSVYQKFINEVARFFLFIASADSLAQTAQPDVQYAQNAIDSRMRRGA